MLKINAKGAIQAPSSSNNFKKMASSKKKKLELEKSASRLFIFDY
jgi:hypothetical protein